MRDKKTGMVKFGTFTKDEEATLSKIIERAHAMLFRFGMNVPSLELRMDISATHASCPLNLSAWLAADDFNFSHDLGGIMKHIDRQTGDLTDCFVPRFAAKYGRTIS